MDVEDIIDRLKCLYAMQEFLTEAERHRSALNSYKGDAESG